MTKPYRRMIVADCKQSQNAAKIYKSLVQLARPLMIKNNIRVRDFFELDYRHPDSCPSGEADQMAGVYYPGTKNLGILLKDHLDLEFPKKHFWRHWQDLVGVLLHELTHAMLDQNERDGNYKHDTYFYERVYGMQQQYYEIYSGVGDRLSSFVPDKKTIEHLRVTEKTNKVTKAIGLTRIWGRCPSLPQDFFVDIRQWAIERKLDSEAASAHGKELAHYHGTGVDEEGISGLGEHPLGPSRKKGRSKGRHKAAIGGGGSGGGGGGGGGGGVGVHDNGDGTVDIEGNLADIISAIVKGGDYSVISEKRNEGRVAAMAIHRERRKGRSSTGISDIFRSMAKGLMGGSSGGTKSSGEKKKYVDKDGYMGMVTHPKNKSFVKGLVDDVWCARSMAISECCSVGGRDRKIKGKGRYIDVEDGKASYLDDDPGVKTAVAVTKTQKEVKSGSSRTMPRTTTAKETVKKTSAPTKSSKSSSNNAQRPSRGLEEHTSKDIREARLARFERKR